VRDELKFHQGFLIIGLVMPVMSILLDYSFAYLGFLSPVVVGPWNYILYVVFLLAITVTPTSIFFYSSEAWRLKKWRQGVLIALELLFYNGILFGPGHGQLASISFIASYALWFLPALLSILSGWALGKIRLGKVDKFETPSAAGVAATP
jgi:hypothetical protein